MKNLGGLILLFGMIIYLIINIGIYIIIIAAVTGIAWLAIASKRSNTPNNNAIKTNDPKPETIANESLYKSANNHQSINITKESDSTRTIVMSSTNDTKTSSLPERSFCQNFNTLNDFLDELLCVNPDPFFSSIVNRIRKYQESFHCSTWSKDDLYVHIIGITNNTIKTSRHSSDKNIVIKECETINYIIKQLQNNISFIAIIDSLRQKLTQVEYFTIQNKCAEEIILQLVDANSIEIRDSPSPRKHENSKICIKPTRSDRLRLLNAISFTKDSDTNFKTQNNGIANVINTLLTSSHSSVNKVIESLLILHHLSVDETEINKIQMLGHRETAHNIICWTHFYVYSADDLNRANNKQKEFYYYFKSNFLENSYIDIEDNWNYAFVLMFDLVEDYKTHKDIDKVQQQLVILGANYPKTARYTKQALNRAIHNESSAKSIKLTTVNILNIPQRINNEAKQSKENLVQRCRWVSNGENIEVNGIKLKRGCFYLGEKFLLPEEHRRCWSSDSPYLLASVLNPELPISPLEAPSVTFNSYTNMTPYFRYQYLQWLSGEVLVKDVSLDILFLYLHGLEIKIFFDNTTNNDQRSIILKNVIELKEPIIERADTSDIKFFFYEFIDCAITKYFPSTPLEYVSESELYEYRTYKNYILEQTIGDKRAVSCDLAYRLAINTLNFDNILPQKYNAHLKYRFDHYFKNQHPRGLRISRSKGGSRHSYSIMSRNITNKAFDPEHRYISCEVYESKFDTWEISNAIREPYWSIEREFSSYNKFIANNEGKETLSAIFALPNYINIYADEKIIAFKAYLETKFINKEFLILEVDELLRQWEYSRKEEKALPKKYVDAIIGAFHILGYGIAPDYNIDKKRFDFNNQIVLYRNSELAKVGINNAYARMEVFVKMATQILYSNNKTIEDYNFIYKYISSQIDSKINQKQLVAYLEWLLLNKQRLDIKLKDIALTLFNESQRIEICDVLVGLCCIGSNINTKRVEVVKKILPLLGIDNSDIHSRIHRIFTGEIDNFVTVEKESNATEFAIPKKEEVKPKFYIDTKKLSEIEKETHESQKLLSEIFNNEETPAITNTPKTLNADLEMLNMLLTKELWSREEVENICKEKDLMLGSLLEKLNDYAYTKVNDAVIDDDGEMIYITTGYKEQLI